MESATNNAQVTKPLVPITHTGHWGLPNGPGTFPVAPRSTPKHRHVDLPVYFPFWKNGSQFELPTAPKEPGELVPRTSALTFGPYEVDHAPGLMVYASQVEQDHFCQKPS